MKPVRLFLLLLLALFAAGHSTARAETPDYIRLHILAASDSPCDQAIKLGVRDAVREYTASLLSDCTNADDAWAILLRHQENVRSTAAATARSYGFNRPVTIEMGEFSFPDRTYGSETVPSGIYRGIRIRLDEGNGQNWWCVLYPSLCLPEDADAGRPVEFYSSILRWLMKIKEAIIHDQ